jgi:hypothetical protein
VDTREDWVRISGHRRNASEPGIGNLARDNSLRFDLQCTATLPRANPAKLAGHRTKRPSHACIRNALNACPCFRWMRERSRRRTALSCAGIAAPAFDSIATLADQLPPEPFNELPVARAGVEPPRVDLVVYRPQPETQQAVIGEESPRTQDFAEPGFTPRFARDRRVANKPRRWPWISACFLLFLAFLDSLLGLARYADCRSDHRPLLHASLRTLNCTLPPVRDVAKLRLLARNVQAHPTVPNALMISASVRNDAAFTQPWPFVTFDCPTRTAKHRHAPFQSIRIPR